MKTDSLPKFGFIVHCRSVKELRLALLRYGLSPAALLPEAALKQYCLSRGIIKDIFTFDRVVSDTGKVCQGKAFCVFLAPDQFLEHQTRATELVVQAAQMAAAWGAQMIGLGALCAVVGARGIEVAERCSAAVTTGNSLTVYAAVLQFEKIMRRLGIDPHRHTIVIIGFPGSICLAITKILHAQGYRLVLVSRQRTAFLQKFLESLGAVEGAIRVTHDVASAVRSGTIIFTATSTGNIIDQDMLLPGSVVFDIAQPKDVIFSTRPRRDVLIVDAGLISLPRSTSRHYRYSGLEVNDIPSCLGETMTLTLEQRWERFSLGRELVLDKIEEIGMLSRRHGFVFDDFRSFQKPIPAQTFSATAQALTGPANDQHGGNHEP
ncbi:MAG: hypothetical protein N3B18_03500 [Desulfobacterota bacterium]|nr:hypothetical protein [Thermodesulfobacteriota bacterium]